MKLSSDSGRPGGTRGRGSKGTGIAHAVRGALDESARRMGRRSQRWAAALAVFALLPLGAVPALAVEGDAPAVAETPAADTGTAEQPPADPPASTQTTASTPAAEPAPAPAETAPQASEAPPTTPPATQQMSQTTEPVVSSEEIPAEFQPVLRWEVRDVSGELQGGVSLTVQGPLGWAAAADDEESWAGTATATVVDNEGQPDYAGTDLDPAPGVFEVRQLVDDADSASVHDVAAGESYRARPLTAGEGFLVGDDAEWTSLTVATSEETPADQIVLGAGMSVMRIMPNPDPPASGNTTLRVTKLGARQAGGSVAKLAGARFYAYAGTRGGAQPSMNDTTSYTCVTNAQGYCDIVVPTRSGGSNNSIAGYWVYEGAAPAGWNRILQIGTGSYQNAKTASNYMFFTGNVTERNTIYEVTEDTTAYSRGSGALSGNNATTTTTTDEHGVADVKSNPGFPAYCGLSIAMVFDISTSIDAGEMTSMKNAANGFIGTNGLGGTDSKVALYKFGTQGSKMLDLTSIINTSGQQTVSGSINSLPSDPSQTTQYTNWDDAMRKVAFNGSEKYDLVLFMTDGDPTVHGTNPSTGGGNSDVETTIGFRNVEEGTFSANAVKGMTGPSGQSTKILAIGIGLSTNSYLNLQAISGPTANEDYYTTGFADLAKTLKGLAERNCGGSITLVKKTVKADGSVIANVTGGWEFQATTPDGNYIQNPPGANVGTLKRTTPSNPPGGVNFPIDLTTAESRTVNIAETAQENWTPQSVACTGGTPTWSGANFTGSFSVSVARNAVVSCTVTNKQAPQTADLIWKKVDDQTPASPLGGSEWTISGGTGSTFPTPTVIVDCVAAGCTGLDKDPAAGGFKLEKLAWGTYTVTETKTPTGYSGSGSFTVVVDAANGGTTIDKGEFKNTRVPGKVSWKKTSSAAQGQLPGSEWKIVGPSPATTQLTVTDCTATPCNGADKDPAAGAFRVEGLAWGGYQLIETKAPPGYLLDTTAHPFTVQAGNAGTVIDLGSLVNVPVTPPTVPLTGGIGKDQVLLGGAGIVAAAGLIAGLMWMRRRRASA